MEDKKSKNNSNSNSKSKDERHRLGAYAVCCWVFVG